MTTVDLKNYQLAGSFLNLIPYLQVNIQLTLTLVTLTMLPNKVLLGDSS